MKQVKLGLKENWKQFTLLVIINAFVGGKFGLERNVLPQIAEIEFDIRAILTGIIADALGIEMSILTIRGLTVLSAFVILLRMKKIV